MECDIIIKSIFEIVQNIVVSAENFNKNYLEYLYTVHVQSKVTAHLLF